MDATTSQPDQELQEHKLEAYQRGVVSAGFTARGALVGGRDSKLAVQGLALERCAQISTVIEVWWKLSRFGPDRPEALSTRGPSSEFHREGKCLDRYGSNGLDTLYYFNSFPSVLA